VKKIFYILSLKFKKFLLFGLFLFYTPYIYSSTLNLSISSNPSRINPILATDSASSEIADWIFNGLFKYNKDGEIVPDLAKSYRWIDDTTLIVNLKQNIVWHDGDKFDSDDVIFTYNTILSPNIYTPITSDFKRISKVERLSDYSIKIVYKQPYFKALNIWMSGILPYHILKDEQDLMKSSFNKNPIGTGSYKLKDIKFSSHITLEAFDRYFEGKPKIEYINYKFISDTNTNFYTLKQKKLDIGGLTPIQIDRQISDSFYNNFKIIEKPSFSYTYMGFNLKSDIFKNPKIREAINLAIDKKELVDILFFGHGEVCNGPFLPGTFAFNKDIKHSHNPQKAKQILKELGYSQNNKLSFTVITNANNDTRVNAAQIIQHQLKKIDIDMKIKILEWQAFLNTVVLPKKFDVVILGWGLSLMPDAYSIWHSNSSKKGGFNFINYSNKEVDKLIDIGAKTINRDKLGEIYKKIFKLISQDNPYIFLYIPNSITAVNKKIKNIKPATVGIMYNQKDWIKE
jgi:peptide/nickel transport system substrate-binding protein